MKMNRLDTSDLDFYADLAALTAWSDERDDEVRDRVRDIIHAVRRRGDKALVELTNRFDRRDVDSVDALEVSAGEMQAALVRIPAAQREALEAAADRVRRYHVHQKQDSWSYREADGTLLGQQVTPLDRAGIYVPGGKAAYPSSVLMNAIPARVAGVQEIIMVSPSPDGEINDLVLAAAAIAGVDRLFTIGGAQAVAALAFGTESVPAVDKIVGPGNIYVAEAKRQVFGKVGIDMIAGPSEILVVCDGKTDPEWIAMDLLSQAEHDEEAQSILLSPDANFIDRVEACLHAALGKLEREEIARISLQTRGALIKAKDIDDCMAVVNVISPEHLELSIDDAEEWAKKVRHAGAIFLGRHTPEALGDYCAGPNHVLPTSATARFSSPLGVYDFQKRSSLIGCSEQGASELGKIASVLARGEGLTAHALSAELRIKNDTQ
ncbi:MAG: histidinol dehydrogenase [Gammaproteobacteria bacterium]|jgi:histidinol dehydrogenase|nr:histidinol dehydrogenase [Gammaproteobacteria bacterium]MBQ0775318.1 histidinol dehydrogenase [Gammaproteobacteria bacterium]|tara:strand:- start:113875 stop:115182 length:1308 start_codon:yes stop_codon:yes gene_type:complete